MTPETKAKRASQRADCKRRQMASIGKLSCQCSRKAFKMSSAGPVCVRCDAIEQELSHTFGKAFSGPRRTVGQDEYICFGGGTKKTAYRTDY